MNKIIATSAICTVLTLSACSSDDAAKIEEIIQDLDITVSGKVTTIPNATDSEPVSGAFIEAVYTTPNDPFNPKVSSDANGDFSLNVIKNSTFYLHATENDYATLNSTFINLAADESNTDVILSTLTKAESVIDTAFNDTVDLINHAWLIVEVLDANGDDVADQVITATPSPVMQAYIECNGTDIGSTATVACNNDNTGPMYIGYFDAPFNSITVAVDSESQSVPVRMGEISVVKFKQ